jgi:hypothetical protein
VKELLKDLGILGSTAACAGFCFVWVYRWIRRAVRWVKAVNKGVIALCENSKATMSLMSDGVSPLEVSRRTGIFEQRITDALEALQPTCNRTHDEDFSR